MTQQVHPEKNIAIQGGVAIGLLLVICALVSCCRDQGAPTSTEAYIMAQQFVEDRLRSPSTADFPRQPTSIEEIAQGHFRVSAYVDSQNAFGATLRTEWTCEVKIEDGDNWTLVSITITPR
jgi:hypothetical protein